MALNKAQTTIELPNFEDANQVSEGAEANSAVETPTESAELQPALPIASPTQAPIPSVNSNVLGHLASMGFEGLKFDWTSFPSISLKNEGRFEDFEGYVYGTEFRCYIRGTKTRWVYRATPVEDNKKDVAFSYDRITTQTGILLQDLKKEWEARGKVIQEREYIEAMVELVDPEGPLDGEYRIVSVSPTSKGRLTGHLAKATALGHGDPGNVVTRVFVGPKVTKVQNPFYPFHFEVETN